MIMNMINRNKNISRMALPVVLAHFLVICNVFAGEPVAKGLPGTDDRLREAEVLFNAGEYERSEALFRAELAIPEEPVHGNDKVGVTPKAVRVRIWLARCRGRLGQKEAAIKESLQLAQESKEEWGWWNKKDRERLAKTIVENVRTPEQVTEIEKFAQTYDFTELSEYFDAIALIKKGDAAGVVRYLTRSDVPIVFVDPALWRNEVVEKASVMKPALIRYALGQIEEAAQWKDTDLCMYHLNHLLQVLPDESFVEPCLGSRQLERRFPDAFREWRNILQVYRKECKKTAIRHLDGDRDSKEHALNLINAIELYDREVMDKVAVVAADEYYPTQVRALLALWRVSGRQFGLEAKSAELALQQANDIERRSSLAMAIEWWKSQRESIADGAHLSMQTQDKDVLEKGVRCRVEMIRLDAANQIDKSKQLTEGHRNIEPSVGGDEKPAPQP